MSARIYQPKSLPIPRGMTLRYLGEEIRPSQAFDVLYAGLDSLIEGVVESYTAHGRKEKMEARSRVERELKEEYTKWIRWTNKCSDFKLEAQIAFDDTSLRNYALFPRTNFDPEGLKKRPSIIWLRNVEGGNSLVLREARRYELNSFVAPFVRRTYGNKFDLDVTRQFYTDTCNTERKNTSKREETNTVRTARASSKPSGVMFLPEPQLLAGLEKMNEEGWMGRLTPQPFAVDANEDKLWYLRHHISTLVADVSPTMEDLGNFFGQMQALGLIEELDRQMIHYGYSSEGNIINYDPDFMVHSTSDRLVRQRDFDDLRDVMGREAKNLLVSFDLIKRAIDVQREYAEQMGITKQTLLDYLPTSVTMEPFAKVELHRA